jgi:hypothetical protein
MTYLISNSPFKALYLTFFHTRADALFYHLVARTYRWSQSFGGDEPQVLFRRARFFLDNEHDFVLSMPSPRLARIQVFAFLVCRVFLKSVSPMFLQWRNLCIAQGDLCRQNTYRQPVSVQCFLLHFITK